MVKPATPKSNGKSKSGEKKSATPSSVGSEKKMRSPLLSASGLGSGTPAKPGSGKGAGVKGGVSKASKTNEKSVSGKQDVFAAALAEVKASEGGAGAKRSSGRGGGSGPKNGGSGKRGSKGGKSISGNGAQSSGSNESEPITEDMLTLDPPSKPRRAGRKRQGPSTAGVRKGKRKFNKEGVVLLSRLPWGMFEQQLAGYMKQFGALDAVRVGRNKKTGKAQHKAWIAFKEPEVARIAAEANNNYLMSGHIIQARHLPPSVVSETLFDSAAPMSRLKYAAAQQWRKNMQRRGSAITVHRASGKKNTSLAAAQKTAAKVAKLAAMGIDFTPPTPVNALTGQLKSSTTPSKKTPVKKTPKKAATPAKKEATPAKKAATPAKKEATPAKKAATPAKKAATPAKKAATPAKKEATPAKKAATPAKKAATPAKKAATPAKKEATPAKKAVTPTKKETTPAKKAATPAKKSPASAKKSPASAKKSPGVKKSPAVAKKSPAAARPKRASTASATSTRSTRSTRSSTRSSGDSK